MIDTGINDVNLNPALKERTAKLLLYIAIGSMIMAFAGLTSAYVVSRGGNSNFTFSLPSGFSFSTAVLLISSITINFALSSAKKNNQKSILIGLVLTLILGLAFMYIQYLSWGQLYADKIYFTGKGSNASGSFMYVITGLHVAHLIGGILYLLGCIVRTTKNQFSSENYLKLKLCAIYWHFLDILWIYLFVFLMNYR